MTLDPKLSIDSHPKPPYNSPMNKPKIMISVPLDPETAELLTRRQHQLEIRSASEAARQAIRVWLSLPLEALKPIMAAQKQPLTNPIDSLEVQAIIRELKRSSAS